MINAWKTWTSYLVLQRALETSEPQLVELGALQRALQRGFGGELGLPLGRRQDGGRARVGGGGCRIGAACLGKTTSRLERAAELQVVRVVLER